MFTVELRDALRDRLLRLAEQDPRVVAGAAVGSLAVDAGDRFSDLDLTFGVTDQVPVAAVLGDWTRTLVDELSAVHLVDLERPPTTYRVGRVWQAEHYVGAVRDHALALACLREGKPAAQARGYDDLAPETLARFAKAHVAATQPGALRAALAASLRALLDEGGQAGLPHADAVARRLADLP